MGTKVQCEFDRPGSEPDPLAQEVMMMREKTTNLDLLKEGSPYTWGHVLAIHEIGPYAIVESERTHDGEKNVAYAIYIDGRDCGISYASLDEAILGAIAYKYDGRNSQAGQLMAQMLGIVSE